MRGTSIRTNGASWRSVQSVISATTLSVIAETVSFEIDAPAGHCCSTSRCGQKGRPAVRTTTEILVLFADVLLNCGDLRRVVWRHAGDLLSKNDEGARLPG